MNYRIGLLACFIAMGFAGLCGAAPAAPNLPGNWGLSFDEEFNAPLSSSTWKQSLWGLTNWSTESQQYSPSAVSVSNGMLSLTATKKTLDGFPYTSGMIDTGPILGQQPTGYSFRYGYADARIKVVAGQGLWPAFWMLPDPNPDGYYHDQDGEIDVMEELGQQPKVDEVHYLQGGGNLGIADNTGVDLSQGFHDYAVNWQPGKIDYYLDGKLVWSVNQSPTVPEYLILNLAVGKAGTWAGGPNSTTPTTAAMQVDYVHVWQNVPEPASASLVMGLLIPMLSRRSRRRAGEA